MKLYAFVSGDRRGSGFACHGQLVDWTAAGEVFLNLRGLGDPSWPRFLPTDLAAFLRMGRAGWELARAVHDFMWRRPALPVGESITYSFDEVQLLAPVGLSAKVISCKRGLPGEPLWSQCFLKPQSSVLPPGGNVQWPEGKAAGFFDAQLAVVLSARLKNADAETAAKCMAGVTLAADFGVDNGDARSLRNALARLGDTFCPIGPAVSVLEHANADKPVKFAVAIDGRETANSVWNGWRSECASALAEISNVMTLEAGDVVTFDFPVTPATTFRAVSGQQIAFSSEELGRLEVGVS